MTSGAMLRFKILTAFVAALLIGQSATGPIGYGIWDVKLGQG
jgi:hypothetical protein